MRVLRAILVKPLPWGRPFGRGRPTDPKLGQNEVTGNHFVQQAAGVGHLEVNGVSFVLPDGRPLLAEVSLRVGEGARVALIGPNGTGKTTLGRIVAGDLAPHGGAVTRSGGLGVMRQFVGQLRDGTTVRDLLVSVAPDPVRRAAAEIDRPSC